MNRNNWYHYLIGGALCVLLYFFISIVLNYYLSNLEVNNPYLNFLTLCCYNAAIIISIFLVFKYYHNRDFKLLISKNGVFNLKRLLVGFTVWTILQFAQIPFIILRDPNALALNFDPNNFFKFLLLSIILVPIQILSEELLFRGYLLKALSKFSKNYIFIIITTGALFSLPHLSNPEVTDKTLFFLVYFTMSTLLTYLTVKYKGLEYSIGIHLANNLFIINILNYPDTPLPSYPIFLGKVPIMPLESFVENVIFSVLIVIIIKKLEKRINK